MSNGFTSKLTAIERAKRVGLVGLMFTVHPEYNTFYWVS